MIKTKILAVLSLYIVIVTAFAAALSNIVFQGKYSSNIQFMVISAFTLFIVLTVTFFSSIFTIL